MKLVTLLRNEVNDKDYIVARYWLSSKVSLYDAAWNIAIGQSVGNPSIRNEWETPELYEKHGCKILYSHYSDAVSAEKTLKHLQSGEIEIAFPIANINFNTDGLSQLLCFLMGGHLDIDSITHCHLLDISFPLDFKWFNYGNGINRMRRYTNTYGKPLLGGIVKPKTGISPAKLGKLVGQMIEGGVNFIKEDEILGNPNVCKLANRVKVIQKIVENTNVIYSYCVNGDPLSIFDKVKFLQDHGANAIHLNVWSGLGMYRDIKHNYPDFFLHFQKSGDRIFTNPSHNFHIRWNAVCKLAGLCGVDSIHAGMWGGYSSQEESDLKETMKILHHYKVMPALSCGMHPGIVNSVTDHFGYDYMANVGGAIHGHSGGTLAGTKAMRQAIDGAFGKEYYEALDQWGSINCS